MSLTTLRVCLWSILVYLVVAQNDTSDLSYCHAEHFEYVDEDSNNIMNITEACKGKICMAKCCPRNQIFIRNQTLVSCGDSGNLTLLEYSEVDIYDINIKKHITKSKVTLADFTRIYSCKFLNESSMSIEEIFPQPQHKMYILENGSLVVRSVNHVYQWNFEFLPGSYCVEHQVVLGLDGNLSKTTELVIKVIATDDAGTDSDQKITLTAYGMLVSCFFLVLVLAVYAALPQLRNLAGIMLMAYVATLTTAFVLRAVQVIGTNNALLDNSACQNVGFLLYYTVLASFTWLNVMSFDIWCSMRGFRKLGQTHRRGTLLKFGWYSLYGWGAPLVPVVFICIVEPMDLTELPDFIKPHLMDGENCFMPEPERQVYMNGPILLTTCINITLFLLTAYNIWRIKSGVRSAGDNRRNKNEKNRFGIYLKLSLVMGINWTLELLSSAYHADSAWWYASEVFNSLIGLSIFIIFICKKNIIVLLCKRFSIGNALVEKLQPLDSSRTLSTRLK